jgi:hypothetical protein
MLCDKGIIKNKMKLFYNDTDKQTESYFRVIDESYINKYKPKEFRKLQFDLDRGAIKEFFGNKIFSIELPVGTGKDITDPFLQHFLSRIAKERLIDDLLYMIIKSFCSML